MPCATSRLRVLTSLMKTSNPANFCPPRTTPNAAACLMELMVSAPALRHHGFCFPQRSKSPLHLQIFISREALHNPTLFHEQLEFSGLIVVFGVACNFRN